MQINAGTLLQDGKYIINHPLETQGFGITYLGTQTEQGQSVVLKTLHPALHKSRAFRRLSDRFLQISQKLSRGNHPNLQRVHDVFQADGWPFMVAEYIHGQSLAEMVKPGKPLAEMEALHYTRAIAAGLQAGHRQGMTHGNLKPENVIRRAGTNVCVVVGYGISAERMLAAVQYAVPGFPHDFTAPEQIGAKGDRVTSADLYSLAALLYFMLTGEAPLNATERQQAGNVQPLPLINTIKPGLQQVIRQGLALDPQNRPDSLDAWLKQFPGKHQLTTSPKPEQQTTRQRPDQPADRAETTDISKASNTADTAEKPSIINLPTMVQPVTQIQAQTQLEPPDTQLDQSTPADIPSPSSPLPGKPERAIPSFSSLPQTVLEPPTDDIDGQSDDRPSDPTDNNDSHAMPSITPDRPRFRREPMSDRAADTEATPATERPRFRQQPRSAPEPALANAGMSIAPPRSSQTDQQLQQRPVRPYTKLPPQPPSRPTRFTLKRMLIGGTLLAMISGIAFGVVLRFNAKQSPIGAGLFEADQSFPNRKWDGTLAPSNFEDAPLESSSPFVTPRQPARESARDEERRDNRNQQEPFDQEPIISRPRRDIAPGLRNSSPESFIPRREFSPPTERGDSPAPRESLAPSPEVTPPADRPASTIPDPITPADPLPSEPSPSSSTPIAPVEPAPPIAEPPPANTTAPGSGNPVTE